MSPEDWLLERLKHHGVDLYTGSFPTFRDRIGHAIVTYQLASVVAGRGADRKPETYAQVFERIYGIPLPSVPRGTQHEAKRT